MYHKLDNQIWFCISLSTTSGRRFESGHQLQISVTTVTEIFAFLASHTDRKRSCHFYGVLARLQGMARFHTAAICILHFVLLQVWRHTIFQSPVFFFQRIKPVNRVKGKIPKKFPSIFVKTPLAFLAFRNPPMSPPFH